MLAPNDKRPAHCRKLALRLQKEKRGLWGLTPEQQLANQQAGGRIIAAELLRTGRGIHAIPPEERSAISRKSGHIAGEIAAVTGRVSDMGKIGGIRGGKKVGNFNLSIGWMSHIVKLRYGHGHKDCKFCLRYKGIRPPVQ